jgi:hypothetical protein
MKSRSSRAVFSALVSLAVLELCTVAGMMAARAKSAPPIPASLHRHRIDCQTECNAEYQQCLHDGNNATYCASARALCLASCP